MPGLLLPAALAALAALALPLLLHLARRSEQRPTPFAALRWLQQRPRPRQRLRIEDWPLLLLRLLLLALLALWLAQPVLRGTQPPERVVAVAPGIDRGAIPPPAEGLERRWLLPGFPPVDEAAAAPPPASRPAALSSLVRELDADLPVTVALTVLVPAVLEDADAQRLVLGRPVDWQVLPTAQDAPTPAPRAPPLPALRHDDVTPGLRFLRAAVQAWQDPAAAANLDIAASTVLPAVDVPLAWWHAGPAPAALAQWIADGGTALLASDVGLDALAGVQWQPLWRDADGEVLLEAADRGAGRALRFTRPLAAATTPVVLDGEFPRRLRDALDPPAMPARADAAGHAPEHDPALATGPHAPDTLDLRPWLAWWLVLVFAGERWLATARRRSTGA